MAKLNLFLARHGEKTDDGKDLTSKGRKQAKLLAKRLKNMKQRKRGTSKTMELIKIDKIISSPIPRCKKTTQIINKELNLPVTYDDALIEFQSIVNESPLKRRRENKRVKEFAKKIKKESGSVLIVSSGNLYRNLISRIFKLSPKKFRIVHYTTGLTRINFDEKGRPKLIFLNDSKHLTDELKISRHMVKEEFKNN